MSSSFFRRLPKEVLNCNGVSAPVTYQLSKTEETGRSNQKTNVSRSRHKILGIEVRREASGSYSGRPNFFLALAASSSSSSPLAVKSQTGSGASAEFKLEDVAP